MEMTTNLHALIFDVDGTLADTERDGHRVAFNSAFAAAGLDWDWSVEVYGQLLAVTGGKERIKHFLRHFLPEFEVTGDPERFVAELHAAKTEFSKKLMVEPGLPLRSGVERLLREARDHELRLGIATTTTPANVSALVSNSLAPDAESCLRDQPLNVPSIKHLLSRIFSEEVVRERPLMLMLRFAWS